MTKPDDIPQEVWKEASDIAVMITLSEDQIRATNLIARAIMAETEACAVIADCDCSAGYCEHREKADAIRKRNEP